MALVDRIVVIFLAFLVAAWAAGMTFAIGLLGLDWPILSGDVGERTGFWAVVFFTTSFSGAVGILPLFLLVVLAEAFRLRSVLIYGFAGIAIMLFGYYSAGFGHRMEDAAGPGTLITGEIQLTAAAGAVFGLVYWLIAGRNAGRWRGPPA